MDIKWIGHACFQLRGRDVSIVTDPFSSETGLNLPVLTADVLTISHNHFDHNYTAGVTAAITFDTPGEFEFKGARIRGIRTFHDESGGAERGGNIMFLFVIDGLSVLHCGDLGHLPDDALIDTLGDIDVLLLPVGGKYTLPVEAAVEFVRQVEPKIVVPMHFAIPGLKIDIAGAEQFIHQLGATARRLSTLSINKATLPEEGTVVDILEPVALGTPVS
ncbi:TPA: MBL fold metallo-hydrolase [Patescibacteria group bacterium]|uniref:Zn-dependent hydrolase n=2 Tax=Bacteria division Kazan-3B-28 TaxID=1798534 RepID=A0A0G1X8J1_UNCK3|nr:MAG: Zn-dependent hydrolase [candidate division Kazan bacterium GW2011_GWA1_50_15]KKW25881.1 MAG: Zn-dependent hydrolase [candidate division Kazan bacterium GW2011_GWC1_52_13]KKW27105.1 MAG: Zn-dependent hydrolase [candidate division Kazan bacterium GW2011_GWB1_52_7]HCL47390.1 MBL fold metallo-hydrolase [Patescibacteria group bacterium]HCR42395.1 MBL fold metallo-hydrolase [Patescibacteria group bacterium]